MGFKDIFKKPAEALRGAAEQTAINFFIKGIESGRYGAGVTRLWFALKGKKSIIGWVLFVIGATLAMYPSPETFTLGGTLAVIGSYLGRFGLVAKGADKAPPPFPEELRPAAEFVLSATTYIVELLTGLGGLLMLSGSADATQASMTLIVAGQTLSTVTGYFASLIGKPPAQIPVRGSDPDVIEGQE